MIAHLWWLALPSSLALSSLLAARHHNLVVSLGALDPVVHAVAIIEQTFTSGFLPLLGVRESDQGAVLLIEPDLGGRPPALSRTICGLHIWTLAGGWHSATRLLSGLYRADARVVSRFGMMR